MGIMLGGINRMGNVLSHGFSAKSAMILTYVSGGF